MLRQETGPPLQHNVGPCAVNPISIVGRASVISN